MLKLSVADLQRAEEEPLLVLPRDQRLGYRRVVELPRLVLRREHEHDDGQVAAHVAAVAPRRVQAHVEQGRHGEAEPRRVLAVRPETHVHARKPGKIGSFSCT